MSAMISLIRPLLSSLLCGVIAFGHAPAWLHVATCDSNSHSHALASPTVTSPTEPASVCSHGCYHHVAEVNESETASHSHESHSDHQHDSDNCVICQSLASPTGVAWEQAIAGISEFVSEPAFLIGCCPLTATFLSIAHPRGPPSLA